MTVDWSTLTPAEARHKIGAALRASHKADDAASLADTDAACAAALEAYTLWENLQVFILTGERPTEGN
ncbi:MAG TPA: hypothetical protein VJM31_02275 [Vicinamibacterales bacterium]|nr:hypothetical protein [Vicinamibacterales bacterium]